MSEGILKEKSKELAKEIVFLIKGLQSIHAPSPLCNQLLRSGTSIGANIHEANYAQGKQDFISKLEISLKECYETEYWIELLSDTGYIDEEKKKQLLQMCGSIRRMLIASVKTIKNN